MPDFSDRSLQQLETCHPDLQRVLKVAIRFIDFTVLEGHRTTERQIYLYEQGLSKVRSGGTHEPNPSLAVDIAPFPIDWTDVERFSHFAGYILGIAGMLDVPLRWGGDWDQDTQVRDERFRDLGHFELRR